MASLAPLLLAFAIPFPAQNALATTELVPFILPWDDTSKTVVSAAGLNSPITAIPKPPIPILGFALSA